MELLPNITNLKVPLPEATKQALAARGIEAPEALHFELVEATLRERQRYEAQAANNPNTLEWLAEVLNDRLAEEQNPEVLGELLQDLPPSAIASLAHAYIAGALPDQKKMRELVQIPLQAIAQ